MSETSKGVELNWTGWPIRPGESYGGRSEHIAGSGDARKKDRRQVICEDDVAAIFDKGPLTKTEAARQLGANTGASRATCYRALDEKGRFARHLRHEAGKLSWR